MATIRLSKAHDDGHGLKRSPMDCDWGGLGRRGLMS